jgi:tripartite-type tricarboxylate transporter receptor subunit TctC
MNHVAMNHVDRTILSRPRIAALLAVSVAVVTATSAQAQSAACEFFNEKTVELVIPFAAGGGFDVYGRMVAKYMGPKLGAANMIVRNQPGAGGLLATNQTWTAKPDGLKIQLLAVSGMLAAELGGAAGVNFKTNGLSWIGRVSGEPDVVATTPGGAIKSFEDARKIGAERKVRIGSTGLGSPQYISAKLLETVLETNTNVITGFSGSPEVYASLGRGELDLFSSSLSAADAAQKAQTGQIIWLLGTEAAPGRPEIRPVSEMINAKFLPLVSAHASAIAAGRALAAPPNMPEDRLTCLRDAFDGAVASEEFLTESKQLNRPVEPLSGADVAKLVKSATEGAPKEYLELLRSSFAQ